jgi:hypothetical protein
MRDGDEMSGRIGRHRIGRYGVGTLWCVRVRDAFFIEFNTTKIATRSLKGGAWESLEPGWKITPEGGQIRVRLNDSEGVLVRLPGALANEVAWEKMALAPRPSPQTTAGKTSSWLTRSLAR